MNAVIHSKTDGMLGTVIPSYVQYFWNKKLSINLILSSFFPELIVQYCTLLMYISSKYIAKLYCTYYITYILFVVTYSVKFVTKSNCIYINCHFVKDLPIELKNRTLIILRGESENIPSIFS